MKYLAFAVPFLALPYFALAEDELPLSLASEGPCAQERRSVESDREQGRETPRSEGDSLPAMEYIYRYSELEGGATYTKWGSKLQLDNHVGGYVRYKVGVTPYANVNLTFRYADYDNSELSGEKDEHVFERALLAGAGIRVPFATDFAVTGNAAFGLVRFDSRAPTIGSDIAPAFSFEGAVTARLYEELRLKAGIGIDVVRTDFHQTSASWVPNLTYLVGFEWGG